MVQGPQSPWGPPGPVFSIKLIGMALRDSGRRWDSIKHSLAGSFIITGSREMERYTGKEVKTKERFDFKMEKPSMFGCSWERYSLRGKEGG